MRRMKSQRISPTRLVISKNHHDLNFMNSFEIRSAANGNPVKQFDSLRNNESILKSGSNKSVSEIKGIINDLQEDNKKLLIENYKVKEENNVLVKINKELQATSIEQQKCIAKLNVEISKLSQYFYRANNDIGSGRYSRHPFGAKLKSEEFAKKIESMPILKNNSVDSILNKKRIR